MHRGGHVYGQPPQWLIEYLLRGFLRPLRQRSQKGVGPRRRINLSLQRCLEGNHAAVKGPRPILVLLDAPPPQTPSPNDSPPPPLSHPLRPHSHPLSPP